MENVKIDFLRSIPLFHSLTDEELMEISTKVVIKEFSKNEVILHEEDTNDFMYVILFGKVKVVKATEEGKEIILAIHRSEEFFGEVSLIDGKTSPATVLAIENSLVAIISKNDFYSLLLNQAKVLDTLLHILCGRLRESWKRIHILNSKNAIQRVKMLLIILSYNNGEKTADGLVINYKLTHQDIADMAGLTRETVTRVLDRLQKDGEVAVLKNRLIRLNSSFFSGDLNK
ncbi:MAG: Crp/Fnr family transcriptional regulator [Candidatus Sulfobium sp.]|jgi:CRP/FNR family cyclic AMP-dependent transcriptional regulator